MLQLSQNSFGYLIACIGNISISLVLVEGLMAAPPSSTVQCLYIYIYIDRYGYSLSFYLNYYPLLFISLYKTFFRYVLLFGRLYF